MPRSLLPSEQQEHHIEFYLCKKIKELGGMPYKFTSPQRRSVPDRICVLPKGYILFVECKRPGEEPTEAQHRELEKLRDLDQWATWVSTKGEVNQLFRTWKARLADA